MFLAIKVHINDKSVPILRVLSRLVLTVKSGNRIHCWTINAFSWQKMSLIDKPINYICMTHYENSITGKTQRVKKAAFVTPLICVFYTKQTFLPQLFWRRFVVFGVDMLSRSRHIKITITFRNLYRFWWFFYRQIRHHRKPPVKKFWTEIRLFSPIPEKDVKIWRLKMIGRSFPNFDAIVKKAASKTLLLSHTIFGAKFLRYFM